MFFSSSSQVSLLSAPPLLALTWPLAQNVAATPLVLIGPHSHKTLQERKWLNSSPSCPASTSLPAFTLPFLFLSYTAVMTDRPLLDETVGDTGSDLIWFYRVDQKRRKLWIAAFCHFVFCCCCCCSVSIFSAQAMVNVVFVFSWHCCISDIFMF